MSESSPPRLRDITLREIVVAGERYMVLGVPAPAAPAGLTAAEQAVLALASRGLTYREIARRRSTSTRTVANQLLAIRRKLGVRSRAELAARLAGRSPGSIR